MKRPTEQRWAVALEDLPLGSIIGLPSGTWWQKTRDGLGDYWTLGTTTIEATSGELAKSVHTEGAATILHTHDTTTETEDTEHATLTPETRERLAQAIIAADYTPEDYHNSIRSGTSTDYHAGYTAALAEAARIVQREQE